MKLRRYKKFENFWLNIYIKSNTFQPLLNTDFKEFWSQRFKGDIHMKFKPCSVQHGRANRKVKQYGISISIRYFDQ